MEDKPALLLPDGTVQSLAGEFSIGRAAENDLVLSKTAVSRRHARLVEVDARWFVEDRGSLYGTYVNGTRLAPQLPQLLRHADRIGVGPETLVFSAPAQLDDPDDTAHFEVSELASAPALSPFQLQVVHALCAPWLAGAKLDELPSNEEIAARLGTPDATEGVKAALRRVYAKAGLTDVSSVSKRRNLCLVARRRGWI